MYRLLKYIGDRWWAAVLGPLLAIAEVVFDVAIPYVMSLIIDVGITARGGDWSIGELAKAMDLQKSTVSARLNELLNDTKELVERPKRKDRVSGITVRPVGLPVIGQGELFN